jgi:hypothetical protein
MTNEVLHFDWRTIITIKTTQQDDIGRLFDAYFAPFAQPIVTETSSQCLNCGADQCEVLGGFVWGMEHGEGRCMTCDWPARAYHEVLDGEGKLLLRWRSAILQYHPNYVTTREEAPDAS